MKTKKPQKPTPASNQSRRRAEEAIAIADTVLGTTPAQAAINRANRLLRAR